MLGCTLQALQKEERADGLIEYILIVAVLALAALAAVAGFSGSIKATFGNAATNVSSHAPQRNNSLPGNPGNQNQQDQNSNP